MEFVCTWSQKQAIGAHDVSANWGFGCRSLKVRVGQSRIIYIKVGQSHIIYI